MSGDELRTLRAAHKLSQARMAELLGISTTRYGELERESPPIADDYLDRARGKFAAAGLDDDADLVEEEGGDADDVHTAAPGVGGPADELPQPPYNPADHAGEDDDEEQAAEEKPKKRRRRTTSRGRSLTAWQTETMTALNGLVLGASETVEIDGRTQTVTIPGLAHLLAQAEPYDATVLANGWPGFTLALVKIAPRHPWLKGVLSMATAGDDYRELVAATLVIVVPIALHHGALGAPALPPQPPEGAQHARTNGGQPAQPETQSTEDPLGGYPDAAQT